MIFKPHRLFYTCLLYLTGLFLPAVGEIYNPILPGFHPDPSCIFVPTLDNTFFCASSTFNAFPGIPIHASKDLKNWRLVGNVLNRPTQLPELNEANTGTSGIWAPTLRLHEGVFYLFTTLVYGDRANEDDSRWDNLYFSNPDIFDSSTWSDAIHFNFSGYDVSPFWDEEGTTYVHGSHYWRIEPHIDQLTLDLETGEILSEQIALWNGTDRVPEGPHMYYRDGWYYLLVAEGGTGVTHKVTLARSRELAGPFEGNPNNPVFTNSSADSYFQTVGHADLFQDIEGNWWATALATRSGGKSSHPMGRETVLTNVTWPSGEDWPVFEPLAADGSVGGPELPLADDPTFGQLVDADDNITFTSSTNETEESFASPPHFLYWRLPDPSAYTIVPVPSNSTGTTHSLKVSPSTLNLTALNGQSAAGPINFISRRQAHTIFEFYVDLVFEPEIGGEQAGISAFLMQDHHIDFSILCPATSNASCATDKVLKLHTEIGGSTRADITLPYPKELQDGMRLAVRGVNLTHFEFLYGAAGGQNELTTAGYGLSSDVSAGFDGTMLGVFATSNGGNGTSSAYVSTWVYKGIEQIRS